MGGGRLLPSLRTERQGGGSPGCSRDGQGRRAIEAARAGAVVVGVPAVKAGGGTAGRRSCPPACLPARPTGREAPVQSDVRKDEFYQSCYKPLYEVDAQKAFTSVKKAIVFYNQRNANLGID